MELLTASDEGASSNPNEQFVDDELTRKLKNCRTSSSGYYPCCDWFCARPKLALCILISGIVIALTGVIATFGRPQDGGGGWSGHFSFSNPLQKRNRKKDGLALIMKPGYAWVPAGQVIVPPNPTKGKTGYAHAVSMSGDGNLLAVGLQGNAPGSESVDLYAWVIAEQDAVAVGAEETEGESEEGGEETMAEAEVDGAAAGGDGQGTWTRRLAGREEVGVGRWRLRGTFVPAPGRYAHHGGEHQAVALSSDGRYLAFTVTDKVFIHRLVTESDFSSKSRGVSVESEHGLNGHFGKSLAFSADGAALVVAAEQRRRGFVRVVSGQPPPQQPVVAEKDENEENNAVGGGAATGDNEFRRRPYVAAAEDDEEAPPSFDKWEQLGQDVQNTRLGTPVAIDRNGTRVAVVKTNNFVSVMDLNVTSLQWSPIGGGDDMPISLGGFMTMSACGKVVAVSSEYGDSETNSVQVYQIVYNETLQTSSWQPMGEALHGESKLERFGASLALNEDGRVLAVGSPGTPEADTSDEYYKYGHVTVYQCNKPKDAWVKVGEEIMEMEVEQDLGNMMGSSLAVSAEGSRVAAGAPQRAVGDAAPHAGSAFVYEWSKKAPPPPATTARTTP